MGRSVSYPANAIVAYAHIEYDEDDGEFIFDDLVEDFQQHCGSLWPSLSTCDKWLGREDHALLENGHAYFGVSEYCGLVAYWIVAKDDVDAPAIADNWVAQVAPRFTKTWSTLNRLGTFSNGEGVFERIAA